MERGVGDSGGNRNNHSPYTRPCASELPPYILGVLCSSCKIILDYDAAKLRGVGTGGQVVGRNNGPAGYGDDRRNFLPAQALPHEFLTT